MNFVYGQPIALESGMMNIHHSVSSLPHLGGKVFRPSSYGYYFFLECLHYSFGLYQHELNNKHVLQLKEIEKNTLKNINEAKLSFFTNITHELRTPIFLITAPLEELISSDQNICLYTQSLSFGHVSQLYAFKQAHQSNH